MIEQSLKGRWQFRQAGSADWLPATAPGGVHTDLLAIRRIPDPFLSDNESQVQWVAEQDWEYRRTFTVEANLLEAAKVFLVCDGLDTLAQVWLNGQAVGEANNMFRQYRWEVKSGLRLGENELTVLFHSPVKYAAERQDMRPLPGGVGDDFMLKGAPHVRKAPCHFGWDWGPKLAAIGIWRDIRLEGFDLARLEEVQVRQQHAEGRVTLTVDLTAEQWEKAPLEATVRVTAPDGKIQEVAAPLAGGRQTLSLAIDDPRLWWPNGLGAQPLYGVAVGLASRGTVLDRRTYQVGLRTLELRQQDDQWGRSFTFVVNGVPVFAKGSNWIPSDSFPTRVSRAQLGHLLGAAAQANHNMVRVWGGGYYEADDFYDVCDRHGLLVWQDFMFSCAGYPFDDPAFLDNLKPEVVENVRRLRHHACLALWCGNNEMEAGWTEWGWNKPGAAELKAADARFFYHTLADWVKAEDPDRPYWPSSPSSHTPHERPYSDAVGDNHLWEVWHGLKPFHQYRERFPRFASEFGFESLPALATVAVYAEPSDWNITSYMMEYHQRNREGNGKIILYLAQHYRLPKDFAALVYVSQVLQAEAMRFGVEHWRRNRERCSGALYWQLNDCWPVSSWSSLDYYGRWKALHYASRRFYAPVLFSIEDKAERMGLFVTNDRVEPWEGEVRWSLETLRGEELAAGRENVAAAPLATTPVAALDFSGKVNSANRRQVVFVGELWRNGVRQAQQTVLFAPAKHVELEAPQIDVSTALEGGGCTFTLRAQSLACFVELALEGADVVFDDNYFNLPAGRTQTVTCPLPAGWTMDQVRGAVRVRSLNDSY